MIKRLLVYRWGAQNEPALIETLRACGVVVIEYNKIMKDYHADGEFMQQCVQVIHSNQVDAIISYNYFPLLSMICEINEMPYISWIYDCPLLTLQSQTLGSPANYIFCFDRVYTQHLVNEGARNCYHFPLAGDMEMLAKAIRSEEIIESKYACDISFVGNLYNDRKNQLRYVELSEYTRGYLEGVIEAQRLIYGYNFIKDSLEERVIDEVVEKCQLSLGELYRYNAVQMAAEAVGREVSAREREKVLGMVSEICEVRLYTGSELPKSLEECNICVMGYADYDTEMPLIFQHSRINLNITSKNIESGIPLRVFDILSCGGFCLTNYQPEIAEMFVDGEELVMYYSMEDMVNKIKYYLTHEEERGKIAQRGYERVNKEYSLLKAVQQVLQMF